MATIVAVVGLLITLIFNTVGVWEQLRQARVEADRTDEARLYTQIGVLTQLAGEARSSQRVIDRSNLPALRCDRDYQGSDIPPADEAALREALGVYDFMAWLFNQGYMPSDEALPVWAPRMIDAERMGAKLTSVREMRADFPELAYLAENAGPALEPPAPCPKRPPPPDGEGR